MNGHQMTYTPRVLQPDASLLGVGQQSPTSRKRRGSLSGPSPATRHASVAAAAGVEGLVDVDTHLLGDSTLGNEDYLAAALHLHDCGLAEACSQERLSLSTGGVTASSPGDVMMMSSVVDEAQLAAQQSSGNSSPKRLRTERD
jgi:hypothetical protein